MIEIEKYLKHAEMRGVKVHRHGHDDVDKYSPIDYKYQSYCELFDIDELRECGECTTCQKWQQNPEIIDLSCIGCLYEFTIVREKGNPKDLFLDIRDEGMSEYATVDLFKTLNELKQITAKEISVHYIDNVCYLHWIVLKIVDGE